MNDDLTIYVGDAGEKYSDPADWKELIAEGRIGPDSVVAYRRGGALSHDRVGDIPELTAVLNGLHSSAGAVVQTSKPPQAEPEQAPEPLELTTVAPGVPPPGAAAFDSSAPDAPLAAQGSVFAPPPKAGPRRAEKAWPVRMLVVFAGLLGLAVLIGVAQGSGGSSYDTGVEETAPVVTLFAARETRVRGEPTSTGSAPIASLSRGDEVQGFWVDSPGGARWLQLTEGPYQGAYVWGANLVGERPPTLVEMVRGARETLAAGQMLSGPRPDANLLVDLEAGQSLDVVGVTETGWVEVTREGGGVGYVSLTAFTPPEEPDLSIEDVLQGMGESMDGSDAASESVAAPPAAPQPSFACAAAASATERLVCEDAELASLDGALAEAFQRALMSSADPDRLRTEQRLWLGLRDESGADRDTLVELYTRRLRDLESAG